MSRMKDRQEQVERITRLIIEGDYTDIGAYLVDNGVGFKDRFEISYVDSIPSGQVRIKPIDYKEKYKQLLI